MKKFVTLASIAIALALCVAQFLFSDAIFSRSEIKLDLKQLDLAITPEDKSTGLMHRKEMCSECGMLFIYREPSHDGFWMKNTFISLDMIFMDNHGVVTTLHEKTEPLNSTKIYYPNAPYSYVLEVNAGFANAKHIKVGSQIDIKYITKTGRTQNGQDLRKMTVIPAEEPGSSRLDLGSARFALDRDDTAILLAQF